MKKILIALFMFMIVFAGQSYAQSSCADSYHNDQNKMRLGKSYDIRDRWDGSSGRKIYSLDASQTTCGNTYDILPVNGGNWGGAPYVITSTPFVYVRGGLTVSNKVSSCTVNWKVSACTPDSFGKCISGTECTHTQFQNIQVSFCGDGKIDDPNDGSYAPGASWTKEVCDPGSDPACKDDCSGKKDTPTCDRAETTVCENNKVVKKYKAVVNGVCTAQQETVNDCVAQNKICSANPAPVCVDNPKCSNGATNYPDCNVCPAGKTLVNGKCEDTKCSNGATNYPECNVCPSPKVLVNGQCIDPVPDPRCEGFTADPNTIAPGQSSKLTCLGANGQAKIYGPNNEFLGGGFATVTPASTTSYRCEVEGTNGKKVICPNNVTVTVTEQCDTNRSQTVCVGERIIKKIKLVENNQCVDKSQEIDDCALKGETCKDAKCVIKEGILKLGDYVWIDANGNGIQDANEQGLAGVTVELLSCGGSSVIATTTTDANGKYLFTNLKPGNYQVRFRLPNGYTFTTQGGGSENDSDAGSNGMTNCINLDRDRLDIDAGVKPSTNPGTFPSCNGVTVSNLNPTVGTPVTITCNGVNITSNQIIINNQVISNAMSTTWTASSAGSFAVMCMMNGNVNYAVKYVNVTNSQLVYCEQAGQKCALPVASPVNTRDYPVPSEIQAPVAYCSSSPTNCKPAQNQSIPVKGDVCQATINVGGVTPPQGSMIIKTVSKEGNKPGEQFRFTIKVTNTTNAKITNLRVVDTWPSDLEYRGQSANSSKVSFAGNFVWNISSLEVGESVEIYLDGAFDDNKDWNARDTRTNVVQLYQGSTLLGTSQATVKTIDATADVSVTKTIKSRNGNDVVYEIRAYNGGDLKANNVIVIDYLPPYMKAVSATPSRSGKIDNPEGQADKLTWNLGSLRPSESRIITLTTTIEKRNTMRYVNSVSITTTTKEIDTNNNSSSATFDVTDGNESGIRGDAAVDLKCEAIDPPSIQVGEYLPFWWLIEKNSKVEFVDKCENIPPVAGKMYVLRNQARCEFELTDSKGAQGRKITTRRNCFIGRSDFDSIPLLRSFADRVGGVSASMLTRAGDATKGGAHFFKPNERSSPTSPLGEYKISLSKVSYTRCGFVSNSNAWGSWNSTYTVRNYQETSTSRVCEYNFAVSAPYRVDKSGPVASRPARYLTVFDRFAFINSVGTIQGVFTQAIDAMKSNTKDTQYALSTNLEYALKSFVDKYQKLATKQIAAGSTTKVVPNKPIYFYQGETTLDIGTLAEGTHIVLGKTIIRGTTNSLKKVMVVAAGDNGYLEFDGGDNLTQQKVSGVFIANKGVSNRGGKTLLNDGSSNSWVKDGRLKIDGLLIVPNGDLSNLVSQRRSSIQDWFKGNVNSLSTDKRNQIYDGGSLVIETRPEFWLNLPAGSNELVSELTVYRTK